MNKMYRWAATYAILALVGGVFYREFTKVVGFSDRTTLSFIHVHLFVLGMFMCLLLMLFEKQFEITRSKYYNRFFTTYNVGVLGVVVMLVVRGVIQVQSIALSSGMSAAISGVSGLFHIVLCVGLFLLFKTIKERI